MRLDEEVFIISDALHRSQHRELAAASVHLRQLLELPMAASLNLMQSACSTGFRAARYGDFVVITMQSAAFVTTAQDHAQAGNWARGRSSLGSVQRDRTAYFDRHETLLARSGCGIATKGHRQVLARIVKGMEQNGMQIGDWSVPSNINESVEIQKRKVPAQKDPGP